MDLDDTLNLITTPVTVNLGDQEGIRTGTAFHYQRMAPPEDGDKDKPQWRTMTDIYLVTNRHVAFPKVRKDGHEVEVIPNAFSFGLRRMDGDAVDWETVSYNKQEFLERARIHPKSDVDVCVVRITDTLTDYVVNSGNQYLQPYAISKENFAGENKIDVEVADDVIVVGYPLGYYDDVNLFPIVKAGIIASRWGAPFKGEPYFHIDAKLFPGSSGSIVLSKPKDFVVVEGRQFTAPEKQFAFLGIYSGQVEASLEPIRLEGMTIIPRQPLDLGIVWYANLVEEIIDADLPYSVSEETANRSDSD